MTGGGPLKPRRPRRGLSALTGLALLVLALGTAGLATRAETLVRQVAPAAPGAAPAFARLSNTIGINTFLELEDDPANIDRSLDLAARAGVGYIRQEFVWAAIEPQPGVFVKDGQDTWARFDAIVDSARAHGLEVIARLDRPPDWARPEGRRNASPNATGPPDDLSTYGDFVARVAERYRGRVKYYQIWNEPNLHGEWNDRRVDPAGYVRLLSLAYRRIKEVDPTASVLAAGLAPTDQLGPQNLSDLVFLEQMYQLGAQPYFDIAAVMVYGYGYPPDDRRVDGQRNNFSRPLLTREIMERHGDGAKPIWASEYGWVSLPPDWSGHASPWGEAVSETAQARYLVRGLQRASQEWPWMGVMSIWGLRWVVASPDDPTQGFALLRHDFTARPGYLALQTYARSGIAAGPGAYAWPQALPADGNGPWQRAAAGLSLRFKGTDLALDVPPGSTLTTLQADIDGSPVAVQPDATGRASLISGLPRGPHAATFSAAEAPPGTRVVVSSRVPSAWFPPLLAGGALALFVGTLAHLARSWRDAAVGALERGAAWLTRVAKDIRERGRRSPVTVAERAGGVGTTWAAFGVSLGVFYFSPSPLVAAPAGVMLAALTLLRPDIALAATAFTVPFLYHPKTIALGGHQLEFPLSELLLVALAASTGFGLVALRIPSLARWMSRHGSLPRGSALLWPGSRFAAPGLLLLLAGGVALLAAGTGHLHEGLREYRGVLLEPVVFFAIACIWPRGESQVFRCLDALVVGGVAVAGFALWQVASGTGTVAAGEVARAVSVYQHPNALGLYTGRIVVLVVVLALLLPPGWRRLAYRLAAVPLLLGLAVSYSRGAWLGVLVALTVVALVGRWRRLLGPALVVGALGLILLPRLIALDGSGELRLLIWSSATRMIADHPLVGVGPDQFLYQYLGTYVHPEGWAERFTSHPHNLVLDYWVRLGIMGLAASAWLLAAFFREALGLLAGRNRQAVAVAAGLLASMIDFLAHGAVDNSYFVLDLALVFWLSVALLVVLRHDQAVQGQSETPPRQIVLRGEHG